MTDYPRDVDRRVARRLARHADRERRAGGLGLILTIAVALAAWACLWVLGARDFINDVLHREAGGITGFEVAAFGAWAFGLMYVLGLGWHYGARIGRAR